MEKLDALKNTLHNIEQLLSEVSERPRVVLEAVLEVELGSVNERLRKWVTILALLELESSEKVSERED